MWLCLWGNVFLCVFKGVIGYISGSLAVLADAVHSGADVLISVVAIVTIHIAKKPADQKHPYGHGKTEFMGGVFTGIVLLIGAAFITVTSLGHMVRRVHHPPPHMIALAAAAISMAVNELLYRWAICAGKAVNSAALQAEAWDNRSDCFSSMPVFFGVLGAQLGFTILDPLAALFVGILVGKIGYELLNQNLHGLMDTPLDDKDLGRMKKLVEGVPGVREIGYLRTRGMGRHYLADMEILINPRTTVQKSKAIVSAIKSSLRKEIDHLEDITVVCEPYIED